MKRSLPAFVAVLLVPASLPAQTAPAAPAQEEAIVLTPFTVNSSLDQGYAALQTMSGTRLATNLRDVASVISAITTDYLKDIDATNLQQAILFASAEFKGKSRRGIYGDAVEELDWSVGQLLDALRKAGIAENTLVVFTSDNGPWLTMGAQGGSAGLLHEGKGSTWEGGMRVPAIAWWPGRIKPGLTSEVAHGMDLFATAVALAGATLPADLPVDGTDLSALLLTGRPLPVRPFFYYRGEEIFACRLGPWKAHFATQAGFGGKPKPDRHDPPLLFHLGRDPSERFNVAAEHPAIVAEIVAAVTRHQAALVRGEPQL